MSMIAWPRFIDTGCHHSKEGYNGPMAKDVIHVSDKEAASDFASLLARVREGAEVIRRARCAW